jgi:hypothetical protein
MKPEFLIYGDLGVHSESLAKLELEAMTGKYTSILHVGDFGYNLEDMITEGLYSGENVRIVYQTFICSEFY